MYICVCNAVTDRDILDCIAEGATSFEQVQYETGLATCCGQCGEYAREFIAQACETRTATPIPDGFRALSRHRPLSSSALQKAA